MLTHLNLQGAENHKLSLERAALLWKLSSFIVKGWAVTPSLPAEQFVGCWRKLHTSKQKKRFYVIVSECLWVCRGQTPSCFLSAWRLHGVTVLQRGTTSSVLLKKHAAPFSEHQPSALISTCCVSSHFSFVLSAHLSLLSFPLSPWVVWFLL